MRVRITSVFEQGYSTAFVRYEVGQVVDVDQAMLVRLQTAGCCEEVPVAVSLPKMAPPPPVVTVPVTSAAVGLPRIAKKAKR
jgi:hypothetical protein